MFRLMDSWKPVAAGLAMLSLAACAGAQLDAQGRSTLRRRVQHQLVQGTIALAQAEFDEGDYMDAVFASRAMAAAAGSPTDPEALDMPATSRPSTRVNWPRLAGT